MWGFAPVFEVALSFCFSAEKPDVMFKLGAPVSEPIRDVYKCYQHLHIITYLSTSAPNIDANMQECWVVCLFSSGAALF